LVAAIAEIPLKLIGKWRLDNRGNTGNIYVYSALGLNRLIKAANSKQEDHKRSYSPKFTYMIILFFHD
jgi:hypothetical protein